MNILLTGASGFIGSAIGRELLARGHVVHCPARSPARVQAVCPGAQAFPMNFERRPGAVLWLPHLRGIDIVINAVGIFREQEGQTFEAVHAAAPSALFDACVTAGVKRVIQLSALGADDLARSSYHLSKRTADRHLRSLPLDAVIVQPSLVYGQDGTSARFFNALASAPLLVLPDGGAQQVQPVHIDDLLALIVGLVESGPPPTRTIACVGDEALSLRAYLRTLRRTMGIAAPLPIVNLPMAFARPLARLAGRWQALINEDSLDMLARGNTASADGITLVLGRRPLRPEAFIARRDAYASGVAASMSWLLPCIRASIALVWIWTGVVSLGLYPVTDSYALLSRLGATGLAATVLLYGAAIVDLILGVLVFVLRDGTRRWLWILQFMLIGFYTVCITFWLPEFWLHPYGPLSKNLPMLAAILLAYQFEGRHPLGKGTSWNT